jgi:dihydroneopterin aldolase/2-amino-4-hydroxy-6-hydroxymethyldihydropteridine diphosphokinase
MSEISISGFEIYTCHGVLAEEKQSEQPFVFDVDLSLNLFPAGVSDRLDKTVNYAEVCELINKIARENCFDLIEKLSYECAFSIMEKFALVDKVKVKVSKPHAPVGFPIHNVAVSAELERTRVILSLGSSMGDSKKLLTDALDKLNKIRGITVKKVSSFIESEPYGGVAKNKFINCAADIECLLPAGELLNVIHKIEEEGGRKRALRWGDRTLDIDIVFFGDKIITCGGLAVPHPDYANRSFVINPIKEIAPDFVCPVTRKRMSDL